MNELQKKFNHYKNEESLSYLYVFMTPKRDSEEAFLFFFYDLSWFYSLWYNFRARPPKSKNKQASAIKSENEESFSFPLVIVLWLSCWFGKSNKQWRKAFILISFRAQIKHFHVCMHLKKLKESLGIFKDLRLTVKIENEIETIFLFMLKYILFRQRTDTLWIRITTIITLKVRVA